MTEYEEIFQRSRRAANNITAISPEQVDTALRLIADMVDKEAYLLQEANKKDIAEADPANGRLLYRLTLTDEMISEISAELRRIAELPSPVNVELERISRPNGMLIRKLSVPFGVVGVIYEARPEVTYEVFALCIKSCNSCILKGGHEARHTNAAAIDLIRRGLEGAGIDPDAAINAGTDRAATAAMLDATGEIDLIIPRGSRRLIDYVRRNSHVPFIETGAGVSHTYFHSSGDIATGRDIIFNAKTRRPISSNSLDCLLIDRERLNVLPALCYHLADAEVKIFADPESFVALEGAYPYLEQATDDDFGKEWLETSLTVKTVGDLEEALDFINTYGSRHSECIVAENPEASQTFMNKVDAACVYTNVSTAFTDAREFGRSTELGISTQKLHARGPFGLEELTTHKYFVTGSGQTR